jgi:hypothetical protein
LDAEAQLAAAQTQLAWMVPHIAMLRAQTLRMHNHIVTAHTVVSRISLHPDQAIRWCSEASQILESELSD